MTRYEPAIILLLRATTWGVALLTIAFIIFVLLNGANALFSASGYSSGTFGMPTDILPPLLGSLLLTITTLLFALPIGIGTAIWLTEFAGQSRLIDYLRLVTIAFSALPSIIYGLFGMALFVLTLGGGISFISGVGTLTCLLIPTIVVISDEALRSVPQGYRTASLALGATRWTTVRTAVLPIALSSIVTGAILGIGRIIGSAAPLMLTATVFYSGTISFSPFNPVAALPVHLFYAMGASDPIAPSVTAPLLLVLTLVLYLVAFGVRRISSRRITANE